MSNRKPNKKYYFTVEGDTEKWYLDWLKNTINSIPESNYTVSIDCQVQTDPYKRAKSLNTIGKVEIYHLSDYESNEDAHVKQFYKTMDNMKKAMSIGKQIKYIFGYSNYSFDLWMVLHMCDCSGSLSDRSQYLKHINREYDEQFKSMDKYKSKNNFERCLNKLNLSNVIDAIKRSEIIMERNQDCYIFQEYKGFKFYKENPSLMIWQPIKTILEDCGFIKKKKQGDH